MGKSNKDDDIDFPNNGDIPPLIPDGDYEVSFSGWDQKDLWAGEPRLFLFFTLQTQGPYFRRESCVWPVQSLAKGNGGRA